jgi:hypothetical protein
MAQAGNRAQPRSMTLMAGPIDCRVNPTKVNELANKRDIAWFERMLTATVPMRYPGAFRHVYPGFVQLAAFMTMNIERHVKAHKELYDNLANGELEKAATTKAFYDEYFAVLDLTAEFYLETVRHVFQEYALPLGRLKWRGETIDPSAIRRTMLLTVEGERDDICAVGQTVAAHDLCRKLRPYLKRHFWEEDEAIYGGITRTDLPIRSIGYPCYAYDKSGKSVLLGAYAPDTSGFDFGALSPPERIAKAVEWGTIIHSQYKNEFDNGMAVSWQHNPSTFGCFAHWSDDARRLHYNNLCAIDGRVVLAGEHASYLSAWQEGAILSALDAVKRLHRRVLAG